MGLRKLFSRLDGGLMVALLFACVSAWPLLTRASLPINTDAHHGHIYRVFEILSAWREGLLYTRWAPDLYYGHGYPIFNFYSPFSYYLAAAYGLFFGPVAGVKFGLVLAAGLGTVGVYLFGRENWGPVAGAVSAAVYAFAPYITLTDPVVRAALPEVLAIGLGPLVLWAFTVLTRRPSRGLFVLAVLSLAALLLTHNLLSFAFVGLTAAWLLWDTALIHRPASATGWLTALALPLAAGAMALGLAAFMWLPAALERDTVQFQNAFNFVQIRRYIPFSELFAPAIANDAQVWDVPDFKFRIGLFQWVFGLLGALTVFHTGPHRRPALFFVLVSLVAMYLILPQADPIWKHVPVLPYLQFSYRLLGIVVPCLAWLAGAATFWTLGRSAAVRFGLATALAGSSVLVAVPLLNPLPWADFGPVTPRAILDDELYGLWGVGTTWQGEFLPTTVRIPPQVNPESLAAVYAGTVEKIERAALPPGVAVIHTHHAALQDDFTITAPAGFVLPVLTFYWPGWTAYLDGQPVPIQVTDPHGFIAVAVPAGTHSIALRLEDTPPRSLGWFVSAMALAAFVSVLSVRWRRQSTAADAGRRAALPAGLVVALATVAVAAVGLRIGWDANLRRHAAIDVPYVAEAQTQRYTPFDNGMALVAYDLPQPEARPGDQVTLTFHWKVTHPMARPASVFVHFYGPNGQVWGQADKPDPVEFFPTTRWLLGRVTEDVEIAVIKPEAPPGTYTVAVGLWDRSSGRRAQPLDSAGQPTGLDKLTLTETFQVKP